MKIGIVGSNGLPGNYGGWDPLVRNLSLHLSKRHEVYVYCSKVDSKEVYKYHSGAQLVYINFKANGFQSIIYDIFSLRHANKICDVIIVLGVSGCIYFPFVKKKKILNLDGLEWKRGKWNYLVKKFLKLSENFGVVFADSVISDNVVIKEYVYSEYRVNSFFIPYGGDNSTTFDSCKKDILKKYDIENGDYFFKVCRIVPENNIDLILSAFAETEQKIVIVGNWKNSKFGVKLQSKYSNFKNLILIDPIYDKFILNQLRLNASVYIHGHSVGGTNPSLVEAMSLALPIFCYDCTYNRATTFNSAIYFRDKIDLINKIHLYASNQIDLRKLSKNMQEIAKNNYTWELVCNGYEKVLTGEC